MERGECEEGGGEEEEVEVELRLDIIVNIMTMPSEVLGM